MAAEALGARAELDPEVAKAVDRLPSSITNRAMGGGSASTDFSAPLTSALGSVDPAFGLLRDLLHIVERRVEHARSGVERREALAAATPSIWPVTGWLSSTFGSRTDPFGGSADFHTGIDIAADAGEPVRASGDGLVTTAQASGNYGRLVVLDHGFGIATRYGHLSRFAVTEGQQVRKGDIIGYVGSPGRSTSPHLHYELLLNGRQANPVSHPPGSLTSPLKHPAPGAGGALGHHAGPFLVGLESRSPDLLISCLLSDLLPSCSPDLLLPR